MSTIGKSLQIETRLVVARGWRKVIWEQLLNGYGVSFRMKKKLELDNDN